ncbi:hypothetical protein VZT92_009307 [Zoarces viviparus]|uniref:Uncharacterized protein n=1 Tax=Zoarces viviparus TaxID=48416 RepID=A0AAW1FIS9_ZOAVI
MLKQQMTTETLVCCTVTPALVSDALLLQSCHHTTLRDGHHVMQAVLQSERLFLVSKEVFERLMSSLTQETNRKSSGAHGLCVQCPMITKGPDVRLSHLFSYFRERSRHRALNLNITAAALKRGGDLSPTKRRQLRQSNAALKWIRTLLFRVGSDSEMMTG